MADIGPYKHTVSGYVSVETALFLEEYATLKRWKLSTLVGLILEEWRQPGSNSEALSDPRRRAQALHNVRIGQLECLDRIFKKQPFVPIPAGELDTFKARNYPDKVRLFVSRARHHKADNEAQFPLQMMVAEDGSAGPKHLDPTPKKTTDTPYGKSRPRKKRA